MASSAWKPVPRQHCVSIARPWPKSRKNKSRVRPIAPRSASYVGRFAPSPTGPLHLGSLICALASFLDARSNGGRWLLRMEDLDPPREQAGAADLILEGLRAHGMEWDGPVLWQSSRHKAYAAAIEKLMTSGRAFRCDCSRKALKKQGNVYTGRCRQRNLSADTPFAVRLCVKDAGQITVQDRVQKTLRQDLAKDVGDFVIQRRDSLYAYQLAVVLDDEYQGINHVLRGSDLYDSTPRQIYLQQVLGLAQPDYIHIPVITNQLGQKLSKQAFAPALNNAQASLHLRSALTFLRQAAPPATCASVSAILSHAIKHWQLSAVPRLMHIPESS